MRIKCLHLWHFRCQISIRLDSRHLCFIQLLCQLLCELEYLNQMRVAITGLKRGSKLKFILSTSEVPAMFTPRHIKKPTMKKKPQKVQEEPRKRALASTGRARRRTTNFIKEPTFTMPRRLSTASKRSHAQIPEEGSPPKMEQQKPQKEQARKLRRVTAEFNAFASFRPGRRVSSQRRISDVLDTRRKSPNKPPKVAEKKVLSPKTAAMRKVVELSQVMCPSPDRMVTRSNSKLLSRTTGRRRTLA